MAGKQIAVSSGPDDFDRDAFDTYVAKLEAMSEEELLNGFLNCRMNVADQLLRMSAHFVVMQKKGFDISNIPGFVQANLLKIASKQLLPGVMATFHGLLFRKISELPAQFQQRLIDGEKVPLVIIREGKTEVLQSDPRALQVQQIRQVFGRGFMRNEAEQVAWIEDVNAKKAQPVSTEAPYEVSKKLKKLIVKTPTSLSLKDLIRIVGLLSEE